MKRKENFSFSSYFIYKRSRKMSYFDLISTDLLQELFLFFFNEDKPYLVNLVSFCKNFDKIKLNTRYSLILNVKFKNRYLLVQNKLTMIDFEKILDEKIFEIMQFYESRNIPASSEKLRREKESYGFELVKFSLYNFFFRTDKSFNEISINLIARIINQLIMRYSISKDERIRPSTFDFILERILHNEIFKSNIKFKNLHLLYIVLKECAIKLFSISGYEMFHIHSSTINYIFDRFPEMEQYILNMNEKQENVTIYIALQPI